MSYPNWCLHPNPALDVETHQDPLLGSALVLVGEESHWSSHDASAVRHQMWSFAEKVARSFRWDCAFLCDRLENRSPQKCACNSRVQVSASWPGEVRRLTWLRCVCVCVVGATMKFKIFSRRKRRTGTSYLVLIYIIPIYLYLVILYTCTRTNT